MFVCIAKKLYTIFQATIFLLSEEAKKSRKSKKTDKPDTFTEKLVTNLLKNMEVKVRDVHVRYEDSTSSPHGTLAAGVTLHSLELKVRWGRWEGVREGVCVCVSRCV